MGFSASSDCSTNSATAGGCSSVSPLARVVGSENELRLIVRLVVHGTEPRHRDDDIAVLFNDSTWSDCPKENVPSVVNRTFSVSFLTNGQG
jgi:hypothetical protein